MADDEDYYSRIKIFNIVHYAGETSYYTKAPLRQVEKVLLDNLPHGTTILDLGCGSGRFSVGAALCGFNVTGLDITLKAIEAARKKALNEGAHNTTFTEGDMTSIPFSDNAFDYVFCPRFVINAVATFTKRKKAIAEMLRVVKPTGIVFIESFNKLYLGRGPFIPLGNILRDSLRQLIMIGCGLLGKKYTGLLPGDIIYKNNKVAGASNGYAHLPTVFELRSMIPDDNRAVISFQSIPQVTGHIKGFDLFKYFRYSIWITLKKRE
jgi:2-polyprenyl-3-methyl-5-hydroxy-6-metoxy-1,4-benzoquinol methylase